MDYTVVIVCELCSQRELFRDTQTPEELVDEVVERAFRRAKNAHLSAHSKSVGFSLRTTVYPTQES